MRDVSGRLVKPEHLVGAYQRDAGHGGGLDGEGGQVLGLETVNVALAEGPGNECQLHRHGVEEVSDACAALFGVEPLLKLWVLGGNADWALACLTVVAHPRRNPDLFFEVGFGYVPVAIKGDESGDANGYGVGPEGQGLGHVHPAPDSSRGYEGNLPVHPDLPQRLAGEDNGWYGGNA